MITSHDRQQDSSECKFTLKHGKYDVEPHYCAVRNMLEQTTTSLTGTDIYCEDCSCLSASTNIQRSFVRLYTDRTYVVIQPSPMWV